MTMTMYSQKRADTQYAPAAKEACLCALVMFVCLKVPACWVLGKHRKGKGKGKREEDACMLYEENACRERGKT